MYNAKKVFYAAGMGIFLFGIGLIALGATLPEMMTKFQINELEAGLATSILPFSILIGSVFFGPIVDQYGYKGILLICGLLVILGLEGMAWANSWGMVQASIFLIGIGGGALNGSTSALVADISEGKRGAKLSLLGVFFGVGALGLPVLLAYFSKTYSNEQIIFTLGLALLPLLVYITTLQYPKPKQQQGIPIKDGLQLLKNPLLLLFSLLLAFESGLEGLTMNWGTNYLQKDILMDHQIAQIGLTLHIAALALMRLILGFLLQRFSAISMLFVSLGLVILGTLLLWQGRQEVIQLVSFALLGLGFAGVFPIVLGKVGDIWASLSGTAFGIALVIALIGNILFNYLMGVLSFQFGMSTMPIILVTCAVLYGLLLFRLRKQF